MPVDPIQTSLRLKAARYLLGGPNVKGKPTPLAVGDIAALPLVRENGISENRIFEIEQMRTSPRPMELEKIALAMGFPSDWFVADLSRLGATPPAAPRSPPEIAAAAAQLRDDRSQTSREEEDDPAGSGQAA